MAPCAGTAQLTAAIANGDEVAFAAFFDAWFGSALALARAVSRRDESFCLDVVQDVMWKVVAKLPPLPTEAAVSAWMTRAIGTCVVDRLRSDRRREQRQQRAALSRPEPSEGDLLAPLLATERARWLQARLAELPAVDRELITARFTDGVSVTAVAQALGLGADAAHGRLRRGLERLRRLAKEWRDA